MARPLHIFLYLQHIGRGGVERAALRLAAGWIALGQRVTLACGDDPEVLRKTLPGAEIISLRRTGKLALFGLGPALRRVRPDVVFCAGNHYTSVAWWLNRTWERSRPRFVWKISNALVRRHQPRLSLWGYLAWLALHPRTFDAIVTMAPSLADEAAQALGIARHRITVIPNPSLQTDDAPATPLPDHPFVLGIGRLEPQKDWQLAITAFARVADPTLHLEILGEGSERATLDAEIDRLGVRDRVHLRGYVEGARPWIARAEALLLTSRYEGAPNVVIEAVAAGTPVVATNSTPALADVLPVDAGEIVSRNAEDIASALTTWRGRRRPPVPPAERLASARAYLALFHRLLAERP